VKRLLAAALACAVSAAAGSVVSASGPLGIYGIVEKVVFEPNERTPERVQVWGAFAYVEGRSPSEISPVTRGYLYFRLPTYGESADTVRKEWADLRTVAGTGQAVGFGSWGYIGRFNQLLPDGRTTSPGVILERVPSGGATTDLRVRPAAERPTEPAAYQTNAGVVRLSATGSHAAIAKQLATALGR
jgi:hypothetical protein